VTVSDSDPNVDALRPIYDAWARGDWRAGPEAYGPTMVWSWSDEFPDINGVYDNPEDSEAAMREWLRGWENWRCEAEEFLVAGDRVVVLTHYRGTGREGIELDSPAAHVWTMREGRASRLDVYVDRNRALRAAGLPPDA
jgi:ketosteroid isomerase-like protein